PPATAPAQAAMPPAAPTPTSAPEPAPPVIAVHYSAYDPSGARTARRIAAELAADGFRVSGPRPVRARISSTSVRYFHDADRAAGVRAMRSAAPALRGGAASAVNMLDLTHYRPQPQTGVLELWIGRKFNPERRRNFRPGGVPDPWFLKLIEQPTAP